MARSLNRVTLIGRVGRDPELTYSTNGMEITKFSVATEGRNDTTDWHPIVAFGQLGKLVKQFTRKGDKLTVEGSLKHSKWEKDNKTYFKTEVVADDVFFPDKRKETGAETSVETNAVETFETEADLNL